MKYIVLSTRPIGGSFQTFGPFATATEAIAFKEKAEADTGERYVITTLIDPITRN